MTSKMQLYSALYESSRRFKRACQQIEILKTHLLDTNQRYTVAKESGRKVHRYTIRMRIMIVEALLRTYCHYAHQKRAEILKLRQLAFGEIDETSEYEEDMEMDG